MPGERNLISRVLRWRTNIYLVIQWLLLMRSYQWGQGTFVVFSHSDPANTHFVSVWAADHRWGTYHNLPGLSPPAVSVCVGLCQYHRRHPACPGAELPSPQVNLHTYTHTHTRPHSEFYCAPYPLRRFHLSAMYFIWFQEWLTVLILAVRIHLAFRDLDVIGNKLSHTFFISCKTRF